MFLLNKCKNSILVELNLSPFSSIIVISIWILIKTAVVSAGFDYCKLGDDHTMCKYKEEKVGPECGDNAKLVYATKEEKDVCVRVHNELRSEIASGKHSGDGCPSGSNIVEMEWDDELEKVAHRWIMQCEFAHDSNRKVERFSCGQNIYAGFASAGPFPEAKGVYEVAIKNWFSEIKDIDENNLKKFGSGHGTVGHFTQVIWYSSKYIGCAIQNFVKSNGDYATFVVCNYGPAGNMLGDSVYKFGEMCSECPDKYFCSRTYNGLCTNEGVGQQQLSFGMQCSIGFLLIVIREIFFKIIIPDMILY